MDVLWLRRERDVTIHVGTSGCKLALSPVPLFQNLMTRRTAEDTRVDEPGEAHAGDVAR